MRQSLIHEARELPATARGDVLCIGNFDGVHAGHTRMLTEGRRLAAEAKAPFLIMTFDPHPMSILKPSIRRPPLMTLEQRIHALSAFSPAVVWVVSTTREFLSISAEEFMQKTLHDLLQVVHVVEGSSFTFGRGALGDVHMLRKTGEQLGWKTTVIETTQATLTDMTQVDVSTTLIRWLISHGRMADAARMLGRPYTLRGNVIHGAKRGQELGYPTVNLDVVQLMPGDGVYAGRAVVDSQEYPAAISVGTNPTFDGSGHSVEAFLLDYQGDELYGRMIDLEFHHWIRDQERFSGVDALRDRIGRDVELVRDGAA
ncbi:MAG TPA: riboflavin biosynthesis protein RibF [Phycisphaerae bacterium]|nr:riboflavin biosynthesis protein RibF [Phycisphaerae bacterium]